MYIQGAPIPGPLTAALSPDFYQRPTQSGTAAGLVACNTGLSIRAYRMRRNVQVIPPWKAHRFSIHTWLCLASTLQVMFVTAVDLVTGYRLQGYPGSALSAGPTLRSIGKLYITVFASRETVLHSCAAALAESFESLRISPGARDFTQPPPQYRTWPAVRQWSGRQVQTQSSYLQHVTKAG